MAVRRGGGQVAWRVCAPPRGVFPENALERDVLYIDDISCYFHYFHEVRKHDERNPVTFRVLDLQNFRVQNHPYKYFERSSGS